MSPSVGVSRLTRRLHDSIVERARWFATCDQVRRLSERLRLPPTQDRDLETVQTVATIKAHIEGPVRTVIDVGAHAGVFAEAATRVLGADQVVCFEPYFAIHPDLRDRLTGLNYRIVGRALSRHRGQGTLRVHQDRSMNSLLDVDSSILAEHFDTYDGRTIERASVEVSTLDAELADIAPLPEPFLIKLDTQGTELQILCGASRSLAKTTAVLVEHMFTTPYLGVPSFAELLESMQGYGFECVAATSISRKSTDRVSAVDFLFQRERAASAPDS